ncbi:hypothetical protein GPECTOR_119g400 [Gonium pectorale]|uniref:J domain-containing protein n=1 Tax=Gonium pectorale TaxID=33097 RepID=A0A150FYV5_GONPE|nr:hypothetical protein GPECTOR_119g400 [Gonium pectorale]|eukprot:KXZ42769.1 hypothetical protein GPECTOR_119g400 [Gonium pectorale]
MKPWWTCPGLGHYEVLGVPYDASPAEIRQAYREAARRYHPDKGGAAAAFARVQAAWEVLGDPRSRAAYDVCALDHHHQYVHVDTQRSKGGEDALLAEVLLRSAGAVVPASQLVVTCELCGRPATRDCSVCSMPFCSFCARRQHWRGKHPMHWPVVSTPGAMLERLGRQEMEAKRLEDDRRLRAADPFHCTDEQLRELRAFNEAAALASARPDHLARYDPALGRLYMWTQTARHVILACYLPNGRPDREVQAGVQGGVLRLGAAGSAPVVHRRLAGALDPSSPLELYRTPDGRFAIVTLTKAGAGAATGPDSSGPPVPWQWRDASWWRTAFVGDNCGGRCLPPPYTLSQQAEDEVVLELGLPWWVRAEDVEVAVGAKRLDVAVRGMDLRLERTCWPDAKRRADHQPVLPELSSWCLRDAADSKPGTDVASSGGGSSCSSPSSSGPAGPTPAAARRAGRCLSVVMARPEPTEEERMYKKGVRQDNRTAPRAGFYGAQQQGVRFFEEDEDTFGLEPLLQAASFSTTGGAWAVPAPWQHDQTLACRWVTQEAELPLAARKHLASLRAAAAGEERRPTSSVLSALHSAAAS